MRAKEYMIIMSNKYLKDYLIQIYVLSFYIIYLFLLLLLKLKF